MYTGFDFKKQTLANIGASYLFDMEIDERVFFHESSRRRLNRWGL